MDFPTVMRGIAQGAINVAEGHTTIEPGSFVHRAMTRLCVLVTEGRITADDLERQRAVEPARPMPTVHLNGTGAAALLDQVDGVVRALRAAVDAMCDAAPNARDYYVQGDDAITAAVGAHRTRIERVSALIADYEEIAEYIADQRDEQRALRGGK